MKQKINDPELASRMQDLADLVGNPNRLAKASGLALTTIQSYLTGTADPARASLIALAKAGGVSLRWLATGEGPKYERELAGAEGGHEAGPDVVPVDKEFVYVPQVTGRISAGEGRVPLEDVEVKVAFRREWISREGNPEHMALIRVSGDSMEPTLLNGDLVLVDRGRNYVEPQGGIYAIALEDIIMIKRVIVIESGRLRIKSDNSQYDTFDIDGNKIKVNGKVIWYGRDLER